MRQSAPIHYLFGILTVFIWAGNGIVSKMSSGMILPGAMSFYRWFFAMLLLTPFCLPALFKNWPLIRPFLGHLAILGALGMVLSQTLCYFAAATTSATNMALIASLIPLMSLLLSIPLLSQPLSKKALLGAALSLSGLIYMISRGNLTVLFTGGIRTGDYLVIVAAFSYALYCVLLKRWNMPISTFISVYVQGLFSILLLLPLFYLGNEYHISHSALPLLAYAAVLASVCAPFFWLHAIGQLGPGRTAMLMNLLPVITAVLANLFLGEVFTRYHTIGGGVVLSGVILAQLQPGAVPLKSRE